MLHSSFSTVGGGQQSRALSSKSSGASLGLGVEGFRKESGSSSPSVGSVTVRIYTLVSGRCHCYAWSRTFEGCSSVAVITGQSPTRRNLGSLATSSDPRGRTSSWLRSRLGRRTTSLRALSLRGRAGHHPRCVSGGVSWRSSGGFVHGEWGGGLVVCAFGFEPTWSVGATGHVGRPFASRYSTGRTFSPGERSRQPNTIASLKSSTGFPMVFSPSASRMTAFP